MRKLQNVIEEANNIREEGVFALLKQKERSWCFNIKLVHVNLIWNQEIGNSKTLPYLYERI